MQQAIDWWLLERVAEARCYKAAPPLVATPEGRGRDSDNAEGYPQVRLLLERAAHRAAPSAFSLAILAPADGARVALDRSASGALRAGGDGTDGATGSAAGGAPPAVAVLLDLVVGEPANLFAERHKHSLACFNLTRLGRDGDGGDGDGEAVGSASARARGGGSAGTRTQAHVLTPTHQLCRGWMDNELRLAELCPGGRYRLDVALVDVFGAAVAEATSTFTVTSVAGVDGAGAASAAGALAGDAAATAASAPSSPPSSQSPSRVCTEVELDGQRLRAECVTSGRRAESLYRCARRFCVAHHIDPVAVCIARIAHDFSPAACGGPVV